VCWDIPYSDHSPWCTHQGVLISREQCKEEWQFTFFIFYNPIQVAKLRLIQENWSGWIQLHFLWIRTAFCLVRGSEESSQGMHNVKKVNGPVNLSMISPPAITGHCSHTKRKKPGVTSSTIHCSWLMALRGAPEKVDRKKKKSIRWSKRWKQMLTSKWMAVQGTMGKPRSWNLRSQLSFKEWKRNSDNTAYGAFSKEVWYSLTNFVYCGHKENSQYIWK